MRTSRLFGVLAAALTTSACAGTPPSASTKAPVVIPKRQPVVYGVAPRRVSTVAPDAWRRHGSWSLRRVRALEDDWACEREAQAQVEREPEGDRAFALMVACGQDGKWQSLRLAFTRPFRRFLLAMSASEQAHLLARIIAARGGHVRSDVAFCRDRGVFLTTLEGLAASDPLTERWLLVRGLINTGPEPSHVTIKETSDSDQLEVVRVFGPYSYGRRHTRDRLGALKSGRELDGLIGPALGIQVSKKEHIFLARLPAAVKGKPPAPTIVRSWRPGAKMPTLVKTFRDRGVDAEDPEVERYALANGLTVILHRDTTQPLVHVNVSYRVGVHHEPRRRSGFAHLFEHLMFQGSRNVQAGQHIGLLESRGAAFVNAVTTFDRTSYHQTLPAHELELALWLEADRMHWLPEGLTEASLAVQKRVVRNERRERLEDAVYGPANEVLLKALFGKLHPYGHGVLGASEDIEAATLADALEFFEDFYTPSRATLVVAGDFEPTSAKAWIEQYFGRIPARLPKKTRPARPPELTHSIAVKQRVPHADHPRVSFAWPGPPILGRGTAELDLLAAVLGPKGGNLLAADLEGLGIDVRDVQVGLRQTLAGTWFELHVVFAGGLMRVEDVVANVVRVIKTQELMGIDAAEIQALARLMEANALFRAQSLAGRAAMLARYDHLLLDPQRLRWELERYQKVTQDSYRAAVSTYFNRDRVLVVAVPGRGRSHR